MSDHLELTDTEVGLPFPANITPAPTGQADRCSNKKTSLHNSELDQAPLYCGTMQPDTGEIYITHKVFDIPDWRAEREPPFILFPILAT